MFHFFPPGVPDGSRHAKAIRTGSLQFHWKFVQTVTDQMLFCNFFLILVKSNTLYSAFSTGGSRKRIFSWDYTEPLFYLCSYICDSWLHAIIPKPSLCVKCSNASVCGKICDIFSHFVINNCCSTSLDIA